MAGRRHPGYDMESTAEFERAYRESPKSRRALREERQERRRSRRRKKWGGLARSLGGMLLGPSKKTAGKRLQEEDERVPKSRRELRQQRGRKQRRRKLRGGFNEVAVTIFVAFVLVFGFVRPFVVEAFRIPSESMVPTLEVGDRVLANKFIYDFTEPERGDIIVFDSVEGDDQTLIKRVVGLPGDKIRVRRGTLYVNGVAQNEPYLNERSGNPSRDSYGPTRVPKGHVFVMGDNRTNSADSRVFGPLPLENVKGEAFTRFWPVTKIGPLSGPSGS